MDQNRDQDQGQAASERWTDEQLEAIKTYGAEVRDELRERIHRESFGGPQVTTSIVDVVDAVFAKSISRAEAARRKRVGASTG